MYCHSHHYYNSTLCIIQLPVRDWSEFYGAVEEPISPNAPEILGNMTMIIQEISICIDLVWFSYTLILHLSVDIVKSSPQLRGIHLTQNL